jgi:hypothetical protein
MTRRAPSRKFGIIDAWWHGAAISQSAGGREETPPSARDHDIARREMFLGVVNNRPHALGDGLLIVADSLGRGQHGRSLQSESPWPLDRQVTDGREPF